MHFLIGFVCIWTVVFAIPDCGPPLLPPPPPQCLPEELPVPTADPAVGLLTQVIQKLYAGLDAAFQFLNGIQLRNNQEFLNLITEVGGPGFNTAAKIKFFVQQSNEFWQSIIDTTADLTWMIQKVYADALSTIEEKFSLVIQQTAVRSWVRGLHDIIRKGRTVVLQASEQYRVKWMKWIQQVANELAQLVQSELCHNPDAVLDKAQRIIHRSFVESAEIVAQLWNEFNAITAKSFEYTLELANNIYEVQILALKYFVT